MVLSDRLRAYAVRRPHLLMVEAPGGTAARVAVERLSRERGWPLVETPADADILVVAGDATVLADEVERVWDQLPGPRSRLELGPHSDVAQALEGARQALLSAGAQDEPRRTDRPTAGMPPGMDMGDMDMGEAAPDPHAGHDMGDMDMGEAAPDPHAGHDMGDMDMGGMEMPAGLAMADRAPDRDGLKLDVLTVPWGPVLPWWPAGLIVTTVLQGDVAQSVEVELRGTAADRQAGWAAALAHLDGPAAAAVVRLDALVRLLGVAGWEGARVRCQRARDALLTGGPTPDVPRMAGRIAGARALARMTAGVPSTGGEDLAARYRRWLAEVTAAVTDGAVPPTADEPHALHALPALLTGTEVGGLRLVVAGLDLALSGADHRMGAGV